MKPKAGQSKDRQNHLFQSRLDQQLNPRLRCFCLAGQIDWNYFDNEYGAPYTEVIGWPGVPTRLMVGLHYLKYALNESDESVVWKLGENPFFESPGIQGGSVTRSVVGSGKCISSFRQSLEAGGGRLSAALVLRRRSDGAAVSTENGQ